jgi:DNA transposition AAA+ family ATPase
MKLQYVKTSNHKRFMAGVTALENRGSKEACILLLVGDPGTGKTCVVDNWGSERDAVYLEGIPGMNLTYVRDYLADQTGVHGTSKFNQYKNLVDHFRTTHQPIILDEAQHGLPNKAECLEYLRRIAEQAGAILVLVAHTSEKHRFASERLAHISTRIADVPELKKANLDDCGLYLRQLCEVQVDDAIVKQVHTQSGGRYRLMANACKTLEAIGGKLKKPSLTEAEVKEVQLCVDAMRTLKREGT